MHFAINWSPEAAELLRAGSIEPDLFKCPDWPDLVTQARAQHPSYVHFPLEIGRGQTGKWDFESITNWLRISDTLFVNAHIVPSRPHIAADITPDDLAHTLAVELRLLVNEFGPERIIIENCPYSENKHNGYLPLGMEPTLFQRLTADSGCGFLLDISHAVLTCETLQRDWQDYIRAMPVERLREMHITGIGTWQTGARGDHMPLTDEDWPRFEWSMAQIHAGYWAAPAVIAFEYGGIGKLKDLCGSDKEAILQQVPRMTALVRNKTFAV